MPRPTKLTPEVQAKVVQAISAGNYYEAACKFASIDYQTFRNWMKAGAETKKGERKKTKTNKRYLEFFEAVEQAEALAEVRAVAQWQNHMPESWQASRDFLARRHPDRWMPKEGRVQEGAVEIVHIYIPDNKREAQ